MSEQKKNKSWKHYAKIGLTAFLTVAACIIFFFIILRWGDLAALGSKIFKSAEPIIIGLVLAYLIMPIKNSLQKKIFKSLTNRKIKDEKAEKIAKVSGIVGAIIFLIAIIALLIAVMVPALAQSIIGLFDAMPGYVESFVEWIQETGIGDSTFAAYIGDAITNAVDKLEKWAENDLLPLIQQYLGQITSGVVSVVKTVLNFVIGIIVVIYVLFIHETLAAQCKKVIYAIFSPDKGNTIIQVVRKSNEIFGGFITGKIIDSAIIGVIAYIGCLIMRTPSALLVAVIIGITNVIPFFGPFIGAIPSILLVTIQSPIHGLYLLIFILILQQIDGNIIGPKILGNTIGLSPFWILTSILIGGGLFGFFGMLLGVPVFAVIYYIVQQIVESRMKKRNLPAETKAYINLDSIDQNSKEIIYKETRE